MEGSKKRPLPALPAQVQGPKPRKFWSDDMIKVLLDTCIEEMKTTGRNGTSLHKKSWVRLGQVFKDKFALDFNQKDMKNGFDNLKSKYIHKRAASFQSKPLPYSDLCEIVFQSISANSDGQWTNTELGTPSTSGASASGASISRASAYGASTIRERVRALHMDDDPLVDVADDDDDDDGNSRAHKIHNEVQPKKKTKTSRVTMADLVVDMQYALRHILKPQMC
ncbi:Myb/SANT-like domain, harbinger transposase-derived nuclease domain protein [Tanacetum coccineum]